MCSLEFNLINLVTNVNLGLVIDVENCIWLQKKNHLIQITASSRLGYVHNFECRKWASLKMLNVKFYNSTTFSPNKLFFMQVKAIIFKWSMLIRLLSSIYM